MADKKMNPRQIAKLVKHLRDAGAYHVEVKADGSITADFPQPQQVLQQYPWFWQRPDWIGPHWQVTYGDSIPCGTTSSFTDITQTATKLRSAVQESLDKDMAQVIRDSMTQPAPDTIVGGGPTGTFTNVMDAGSSFSGYNQSDAAAAPQGGSRVTFTAH